MKKNNLWKHEDKIICHVGRWTALAEYLSASKVNNDGGKNESNN
jgi:hypothetical protein